MEFELWHLIAVPALFAAGWWFKGLDQKQQDREREPETYYRGINLLLNDQPDKAIDAFIQVVKLDPETIELHHALGNLFCRRGEFDRAVRIHNHLLNRADLPQEARALALYELANDYLKAGIYDRAEQSFKRLMEEANYRLEAMRALLNIYCTEKEWEAAIAMAEALEKEAGENHQTEVAHFYCELAERALRGKQVQEAKNYLRQAMEVDHKSVRALMLQGKIALQEGNAREALNFWGKVEKVSAEHLTLVMTQMAQAYEALGEHEQAVNLIHRALADRPNSETLALAVELMTKTEGDAAAKRLLSEELQRHPTLWAYERLAQMRLKEDPDNKDLALLVQLLKPVVSRPGRYQCSHCGFRAKGFQWLCPGCSSWGSYPPNRTED